MSTKETIICDRCKKEMSKHTDSYYKLKITWRKTTDTPRERDLCDECLRDLMTFIDSSKERAQ